MAIPARAYAGGGGPVPPGCPPGPTLGNADTIRAEFGGWGVWGRARLPSPGSTPASGEGFVTNAPPPRGPRVDFGAGGGGLRIVCGWGITRWVVLDLDFRLAGTKQPSGQLGIDIGLEFGAGFGGIRWRGRAPGSFAFGGGAGVGLGRPNWFGLSAAIYPYGFSRFLLQPSDNTRIQLDYRMMPISTQYKYYNAWVMAHDAAIAAGYKNFQGGIRGRLEYIDLLDDPTHHDYQSLYLGAFVAWYGFM